MIFKTLKLLKGLLNVDARVQAPTCKAGMAKTAVFDDTLWTGKC
jgi:hypothetical protein